MTVPRTTLDAVNDLVHEAIAENFPKIATFGGDHHDPAEFDASWGYVAESAEGQGVLITLRAHDDGYPYLDLDAPCFASVPLTEGVSDFLIAASGGFGFGQVVYESTGEDEDGDTVGRIKLSYRLLASYLDEGELVTVVRAMHGEVRQLADAFHNAFD